MAQYAPPARLPAAARDRDAPRAMAVTSTLVSPASRALRNTAQRLNERPVATVQRAAAARVDRPVARLSREPLPHMAPDGGAPVRRYARSNGAERKNGRGQ